MGDEPVSVEAHRAAEAEDGVPQIFGGHQATQVPLGHLERRGGLGDGEPVLALAVVFGEVDRRGIRRQIEGGQRLTAFIAVSEDGGSDIAPAEEGRSEELPSRFHHVEQPGTSLLRVR